MAMEMSRVRKKEEEIFSRTRQTEWNKRITKNYKVKND